LLVKSLDAGQRPQEIADALNTVANAGERIVIKRHGTRTAVLAPVDDLELLEVMEDHVDVALGKKALKEKGRIPWAQAKQDLGP
jgi:PHD/YefM family antitoxin component YafN of YafNO toxin-antitoxin module